MLANISVSNEATKIKEGAQTFTSNSLKNIYYSLSVHLSTTEQGYHKGATNFIDVRSIYCRHS